MSEIKETFSVVSHSCYGEDGIRVYSETSPRDVEYMERYPSMYTLLAEGLTEDEVDDFIHQIEREEEDE